MWRWRRLDWVPVDPYRPPARSTEALVKERPNNPVEFLAAYLLKNNPQGPSNPPQVPGA